HCVTRAGLASTTLLAVGIPARALQIIPPSGNGHNVIEVWDAMLGWVVVDPTVGGVLADAGGPISAARAVIARRGVRMSVEPGRPQPAAVVAAFYASGQPELFNGQLLYPEPWLYTRVGPRVACWPLRGAFARVGSRIWTLGPAQWALQRGVALTVLAGAAAFI